MFKRTRTAAQCDLYTTCTRETIMVGVYLEMLGKSTNPTIKRFESTCEVLDPISSWHKLAR